MKHFQADPRLERILKSATESEITGGVAANILMPLLLHIDRPTVRIDRDVVSAIRVMFGRPEDHIDAPGHGRPPGNLDTLKNFAKLEWPMHLRGTQQKALTKLLVAVVDEAAKGALEYERYTDARRAVNRMQEKNQKDYHLEQIDSPTFLAGKSFLDELEGSVRLLGQPHAARILKRALAADGETVLELVRKMSDLGLCFAPSSPSSKDAYASLHKAMVQVVSKSDIDVRAFMPKPKSPVRVAGAAPKSLRDTRWVGSETLQGYGNLAFKFGSGNRVVMIDARSTVHGSYEQKGAAVTLTFPNVAEYTGAISGGTMSGTGRSDNGVWNWNVTYQKK